MPTLTNVYEIQMAGTLAETAGAKNILNVFHYRLSAGSQDAYAQLLGDFETKVFSFVLAQLTIDYTLTAMRVRKLDDALEQFTTVTTSTPGSIALPRLPGDLAIVTPLQCATRGKSFRGRKHFRGIPTASVLKDELTAGAETAWLAIAAKLLLAWTSVTGTYQPVVVSRVLSQLKTNPTSIVGSDVNSVLVNKTIGTFRRSKEKTQR